MGEHLLRDAAARHGLEAQVASAGFLYAGEPASLTAASVMAERGFDLTGHRSQLAEAELVAAHDLVVTMERRHARELSMLDGVDGRRVHTFKGLAEALVAPEVMALPSGSARVEAVADARTAASLLGEGADEVADPHGRSRRRHRQAADALADAADAIVRGLSTP